VVVVVAEVAGVVGAVVAGVVGAVVVAGLELVLELPHPPRTRPSRAIAMSFP
jgi:hypothetical protein